VLLTLARAQDRLDHWTADDGLPQNTIFALLQTRDGYLWFTTLDGLVRYDGVRFTVFARGQISGLASNRFNNLCEDAAGDLWIGTEDGGLTRYRSGRFTTYTRRDGLPSDYIRGLFNDGERGMLVVTGSGPVHWRGDRFIPYPSPVGKSFSKFSYLSASGALWDRDNNELHRFKDGQLSAWPLTDATGSEPLIGRYEDRQGNLWIGTRHDGLQRWQAGKLTTYTARDGLPPGLVCSFVEDLQGALWLGTTAGELLRFASGRFTLVQRLTNSALLALLADREGNLWLATERDGLYRWRRQSVTFYSQRDGLAGDNVYPICEDVDGTVWLAGSGGLSKFKAGVFIHQGLPDAVTALHASRADRGGRLWLGGVGRLSQWQGGSLIPFSLPPDFGERRVQAVWQDSAGQVWLGTGDGLFKLKDGQSVHYTMRDGLAGDDVKEIFEDRAGRLWFATYGGLSRWEQGRFVSFTEADGLASNRVRTLHEDAEGSLWIGSYDGGLTRFKNGRFTRITTRDGLFNNGVFRILEDERGNFWMSCNRGIYRVSRQQLNDFADGKIQVIVSVSYGKADGLANTECNGGQQPAGWKTRDSKLWFPTQGGVAVIDPQTAPYNPLPPPVAIEECLIDGAPMDLSSPITLAPGQENLEVHYTGLSFIKPEHMHFKYQLAGLDQTWVDVGARRVAYFNHLPPGNYTFKVIAANSDGVWNETGASLPLRIVPPFWRTGWFLALMVIGLAGFVVLIYERRVRLAQAAQAAQAAFARQLIESQEYERQRIASELHDGLGQSLAIIKNRALLSLGKPGDHERALTQLGEISEAATQAIEEAKEIAYNLHPYQLDRLGLTAALESMIHHVADASGIAFTPELAPLDGLLTREAEINLYRIVQESLNNIVKHSRATSARVTLSRDAQRLRLTIADNGQGFVRPPTSARRGWGLTGITERARLLGAVAEIHSEPGRGTTVNVELELNPLNIRERSVSG
jgi:signal transduction histidine kinase/ligand-binding sensor domain-containing protein